jgi:hypothetical protein
MVLAIAALRTAAVTVRPANQSTQADMHAGVAWSHTFTTPLRFAGARDIPDTIAGTPAGVLLSFAFPDRIDSTRASQSIDSGLRGMDTA